VNHVQIAQRCRLGGLDLRLPAPTTQDSGSRNGFHWLLSSFSTVM
jgi:hypothetical protein